MFFQTRNQLVDFPLFIVVILGSFIEVIVVILRGRLQLRLVLDFIVVHISHEDLLRVLLIGEYVALYKFYASVVKSYFDLEVLAKVLQQLISLDIWI